MRLLIDTHALIWAVDDSGQLGPDAAKAMSDPANELSLSAASVWELAIKVSLGKLRLSLPFRVWMERAIADLGVALIPITVEFADVAAKLPSRHGDPFDRMIIAQAQVDHLPIASADPMFDRYGVQRIW